MHDVFISYSHDDMTVATTVLSILESNGIKCWIDYRDETPGGDYSGSIVRAIRNSKFFVLLLSEKSSNSAHVLGEVNSAVKSCVTIIPFKIDDSELSDNMEYYMGKTHWLEALTPPLEAHVNKLVKTIREYNGKAVETPVVSRQVPEAKAKKTSGCRVVDYQQAIDLGYTSKKIALQLVENDYINCNGIEQANEGTASQWEEFLQNDSDTFHYLLNENDEIVGDWSIVALDDETFEQAMNGELLEENISIDNTNMLCFPGEYDGYILSISLLPEYRNMKNYNMLIDSFLKQMEEYAENGIFFKRWCMNVFGKEVEALIKQLGFKYVCDNVTYGKIYEWQFMPLSDIPLVKRYKKLVELYEEQQ